MLESFLLNMTHFDPDIWGTVSDWFMFLITSLTAFYLYKTLQSQKEVQRTQNELFKIESLRFRESIRPNLNFTISDKIIIPEENTNGKIFTIEISNENDNTALDISIENRQTSNAFQISIFPPKQKYLKKGSEPYLLNYLIEDFNKNLNDIIFWIHYKDISGTKYKQGIICNIDNFGNDIKVLLPEEMN
ncbi:hypothetical protein FLACOL7796_03915 [Flavobacterium collinsii]|uniref:SMODS-associating 2TM beta-strand rich effector domain-containing protein n=2 Tax=Flavobacterium collinsii TaxID=1114861 RepID=A0ABN7EP39_9FLAO|nr:hypothetical protein FLACOL7796_03915 [Flavobacterium collinsii]